MLLGDMAVVAGQRWPLCLVGVVLDEERLLRAGSLDATAILTQRSQSVRLKTSRNLHSLYQVQKCLHRSRKKFFVRVFALPDALLQPTAEETSKLMPVLLRQNS